VTRRAPQAPPHDASYFNLNNTELPPPSLLGASAVFSATRVRSGSASRRARLSVVVWGAGRAEYAGHEIFQPRARCVPVELASSTVQQIGRILKASKVRQGSETSPRVGDAMVTDSTITFADMQSTERACLDLGSQSVAGVIDHVLSGTVDYEIRGDELILSGQGNGLLIYTPGR
jgi:hypothetical protein